MTTTALYQNHLATEAAYQADDINLDKMQAADLAYRAWLAAIKVAREEWQALPSGDRKDSAETNAEDTEGCAEDELRWFEIALMTYELHE